MSVFHKAMKESMAACDEFNGARRPSAEMPGNFNVGRWRCARRQQQLVDALALTLRDCLRMPAPPGRYIEMVNSGKVKMRSRGDAAKELEASLQEARKLTLELIKSVTSSTFSDYLVMTVDRYMETHNKRTPQQDGLATVHRKVEGVEREVVLLRKQAAGEWNLRVGEEERVQQREEVDNHADSVREGQLEAKYRKIAGSVGDLQMDPSAIKSVQQHEDDLATAADPDARPAGEALDDDDGDEGSGSEDHDSIASEDEMLDSLLGSKKPPAAKGKAKAAAAKAKEGGKAASSSAKGGGSAVAAPAPSPAKPRGSEHNS